MRGLHRRDRVRRRRSAPRRGHLRHRPRPRTTSARSRASPTGWCWPSMPTPPGRTPPPGSTSGSGPTRSTWPWRRCPPASILLIWPDPIPPLWPRPWPRPRPFLGFRLDRVLDQANLTTPEGRARAAEAGVRVVDEHPNPLVRDQYLMQVGVALSGAHRPAPFGSPGRGRGSRRRTRGGRGGAVPARGAGPVAGPAWLPIEAGARRAATGLTRGRSTAPPGHRPRTHLGATRRAPLRRRGQSRGLPSRLGRSHPARGGGRHRRGRGRPVAAPGGRGHRGRSGRRGGPPGRRGRVARARHDADRAGDGR